MFPPWAGFLFLAVVMDVFSRRIVGWAMASHLRTELILDVDIEYWARCEVTERAERESLVEVMAAWKNLLFERDLT